MSEICDAGKTVIDMDAIHADLNGQLDDATAEGGTDTNPEAFTDTSQLESPQFDPYDKYTLSTPKSPSRQSPWRPWTPMDSHATEDQAHMQGGPSAYARRARHRHNEDRAQGAYRQLPLRDSGDRSQRNHRRSKEEEQCIGDWQDRQTGPEVEEQCRRGRHIAQGGQGRC
ncbi:uncharacterized protein UHOD_11434 [Ustilago sp. UG-2017b]|nr:uncharacterized protein UHOD_11434 [Ustilago sp. UG-2017b]